MQKVKKLSISPKLPFLLFLDLFNNNHLETMARTLYFPGVKTEPLITPNQLKRKLQLTVPQKKFINQTRQDICNILDGNDKRIILIVGPCSIHDPLAAIEYGEKLQTLSQEVSKSFLVIMRVYFEKSRTCLGWKGMMYDPHLDGSNDINEGLNRTRTLLLDLINMGIPAAAEILDPMCTNYMNDLITWGCIGARTASSQIHRQMASDLEFPIGFKNNTDGNIAIAINGVQSATHPHSYIGINSDGITSHINSIGNPHCHIVLRGGALGPNHCHQSIKKTLNLLHLAKQSPRVIIDCSHDNSGRCHQRQRDVFDSIIDQYCQGRRAIKGAILESNLYAGNQEFAEDGKELKYGVSITDSCLDWESTKTTILAAKAKLEQLEKRVKITQTSA